VLERFTSEGKKAPAVDYRTAVEALARSIEIVGHNVFDEAHAHNIQSITNEEAKTYFEALSNTTEASAGNRI